MSVLDPLQGALENARDAFVGKEFAKAFHLYMGVVDVCEHIPIPQGDASEGEFEESLATSAHMAFFALKGLSNSMTCLRMINKNGDKHDSIPDSSINAAIDLGCRALQLILTWGRSHLFAVVPKSAAVAFKCLVKCVKFATEEALRWDEIVEWVEKLYIPVFQSGNVVASTKLAGALNKSLFSAYLFMDGSTRLKIEEESACDFIQGFYNLFHRIPRISSPFLRFGVSRFLPNLDGACNRLLMELNDEEPTSFLLYDSHSISAVFQLAAELWLSSTSSDGLGVQLLAECVDGDAPLESRISITQVHPDPWVCAQNEYLLHWRDASLHGIPCQQSANRRALVQFCLQYCTRIPHCFYDDILAFSANLFKKLFPQHNLDYETREEFVIMDSSADRKDVFSILLRALGVNGSKDYLLEDIHPWQKHLLCSPCIFPNAEWNECEKQMLFEFKRWCDKESMAFFNFLFHPAARDQLRSIYDNSDPSQLMNLMFPPVKRVANNLSIESFYSDFYKPFVLSYYFAGDNVRARCLVSKPSSERFDHVFAFSSHELFGVKSIVVELSPYSKSNNVNLISSFARMFWHRYAAQVLRSSKSIQRAVQVQHSKLDGTPGLRNLVLSTYFSSITCRHTILHQNMETFCLNNVITPGIDSSPVALQVSTSQVDSVAQAAAAAEHPCQIDIYDGLKEKDPASVLSVPPIMLRWMRHAMIIDGSEMASVEQAVQDPRSTFLTGCLSPWTESETFETSSSRWNIWSESAYVMKCLKEKRFSAASILSLGWVTHKLSEDGIIIPIILYKPFLPDGQRATASTLDKWLQASRNAGFNYTSFWKHIDSLGLASVVPTTFINPISPYFGERSNVWMHQSSFKPSIIVSKSMISKSHLFPNASLAIVDLHVGGVVMMDSLDSIFEKSVLRNGSRVLELTDNQNKLFACMIDNRSVRSIAQSYEPHQAEAVHSTKINGNVRTQYSAMR